MDYSTILRITAIVRFLLQNTLILISTEMSMKFKCHCDLDNMRVCSQRSLTAKQKGKQQPRQEEGNRTGQN